MNKNKRALFTVLLSALSVTVLAASIILAMFIANRSSNPRHTAASIPAVNTTQQASTNTAQTNSMLKSFTTAELKQYDGKNGHSAYVAVSGKVYDVTNSRAFMNGMHKGYSAGQDLTDAIQSAPHGTSVLDGLPVVGTLAQ